MKKCINIVEILIGAIMVDAFGGEKSFDVTGIGLKVLVGAHFVLFVLAIIALIVKISYNNERKQAVTEETESREEEMGFKRL